MGQRPLVERGLGVIDMTTAAGAGRHHKTVNRASIEGTTMNGDSSVVPGATWV